MNIHNNTPKQPSHTAIGIINNISPKPIGSSLRFLKFSQTLVMVYIKLKNIKATEIPKIEFKSLNSQSFIIEYNGDMTIIGISSL